MFTPDYPEEEAIPVGKLIQILSQFDSTQIIKVNPNKNLNVYSSLGLDVGSKPLGQIKIGEEIFEKLEPYIGEF